MKRVVLLGLFLVIALSVSANAQTAVQREPLVGLRGVRVLVEDIRADAEHDGLHRDQVVTDVELRLRKNGIRVLEWMKNPGAPYLYISFGTNRNDKYSIYAYAVTVQLMQSVSLEDRPSIKTVGAVWQTQSVGTVGVYVIRTIREVVNDLVDKFINDYLAVNPK